MFYVPLKIICTFYLYFYKFLFIGYSYKLKLFSMSYLKVGLSGLKKKSQALEYLYAYIICRILKTICIEIVYSVKIIR